jgi:hypothetical protein
MTTGRESGAPGKVPSMFRRFTPGHMRRRICRSRPR